MSQSRSPDAKKNEEFFEPDFDSSIDKSQKLSSKGGKQAKGAKGTATQRDRSNTSKTANINGGQNSGNLAPIKELVKGQNGKNGKSTTKQKTTPKTVNEDQESQDVTPGRNKEDQADNISQSTAKKSQSYKNYSRQETNQKSGLGNDPTELKMENEKLQRKIQMLNQQLASQSDSVDQVANLRKKLKESEEKNKGNFKEIMDLKGQIGQLNSDINILNGKITSHEFTIQTLEETLEEKGNEAENMEKDAAGQQEELEELENNLQQKEEEFYVAKKELREMTIKFNEADEKLSQATERIAELMKAVEELVTQQHIYIGHKRDLIDLNLANYLNLYPEKEKRKILFLRESEGVYQFGQKKVYVKVEKGNQIKVRVGGGYMSIDDFLELYTDIEVDKIERRDVIQRFQNKLAVQKISVEQARHAHEMSPIRGSQRPGSPVRVPMAMQQRAESPERMAKSPNPRRERMGSPMSRKSLNKAKRTKTPLQGQNSPSKRKLKVEE